MSWTLLGLEFDYIFNKPRIIIYLFICRWDFKMPGIVDKSILVLAKAGSGVAMFNMGI